LEDADPEEHEMMLIEQLEGRRLFVATLPMAAAVLPLTPADSHAKAPTVTVPAAATDHALAKLTEALAKHAKGKPS
jgi:hypothetical protein